MTLPTAAYRHSSSSYLDATVDVPRHRQRAAVVLNKAEILGFQHDELQSEQLARLGF